MFRATDLIDLPIIALKEAKAPKCTAKSLLFDGLNNKIAAFVCKEGGLKKFCHAIFYEKIIAIDVNGIMIPDYKCIEKVPIKVIEGYIPLEAIVNKTVKDRSGELHGIITDIYINLLNGKITGYELSEGYIDDLVNGRRKINIKDSLEHTITANEILLQHRFN
jgi:uncharacterized protein YrrD